MKILIKNAFIFDENRREVKKDICIDGNRIISVGDVDAGFVPDKTIEADGKLALPGLINAHTHAYMALFRNYADDQAFWDWLNNVMAVEEHITEEDCYWGTLLNSIEMIKTGTTGFIDMAIKSTKNKAMTGPESANAGATYESGLRAILTRGMIGSVGEDYPERQVKMVLDEMDAFKGQDRVKFWFGPHAPYSCMADNLQRLTKLAAEMGIGINIHASESETEVENMIKEKGVTPIRYLADLGVFDVPTIAAHCVNATDDDIKIMAEHNVTVAINPKSNMKLGNGFAPVEKFVEGKVNVALGTDGCGSNNSQNMFSEMNVASLIYKGANKKAQCISAEDVFDFATVNGAKAMGLEGQLGVIKPGALADIIILDIYEPQFFPRNNMFSGLAYSTTGREVETVIVDGNIVMENNVILTIDVDRVYAECEKIAERLGMHR